MNLLEFSNKHEEAFLYALNYLGLSDTVSLASTCKELHTSLEYRCTSLVQDKLTKAFSDQLYRGSRLEIKGCWHIVDTLNQIPIYVANNHIFAPSEKKTGGCALGTIYTKEEVRWIGKVGRQRGFVRKGILSTRSCTKKDVNLDAIREKCAFDLYGTFSQGMFFVPNTYLSCQKVVDPFTKHHPRYCEQIFQLTTRGIHKCLRIMVEFVDGYKDFKYAKTRFEGKVWTFIDFLKHFHRPPEELLTDDDRCVPLKGIMELSATARVLLADTDYLGGTLDNSGWIWEYNRQGLITGALTVKIDPGEALGFIFNDYDCYNRVFFTKEQLAPPHWRLADLKDIQVANQNHALTILWKDLTESQKKQFLDHAHNLIQQILSSDQERYHCFFRNGGFYRNSVKEMPEEIALQLSKGMKEWVELQRTIYEEGLTLRNVFFYSPKPLVNFVGREDVLSQLTAALVSVHFDPQAPAATAVVCAEGGMGKSELAAQFADLQKTIFSPIFWVNSDSPTALRNSYLALAGALKLYIEEKEDLENIREVVHKALEERNADRPYLLIFNNASDVLTLPQKGGSNLITTRRNDLWEKEIVIPLPPLSLSEASSYIEKVIGPQPSDKIAIFLEKTEGSPLALAQAAAMMKNRTIGIAEYLLEFHQFEMKEPIYTNSSMIFSYFETIEPLALDWLKLCAFLHPDAISQDWLESWLEGQQATEEKTFDILLLLKEYSLIHFDFQQRTFSLHSHLQKVLPPFVSKEKASLAEQAIQLLNKSCSFDHDQFDTWEDAQAWLLHAQYFLVQEAGISSSTGMARLLCNAAKIAIEFAKRRESINLLERALAIQQTGVMNDEESAELFSLLGLAYRPQLHQGKDFTTLVDKTDLTKAHSYAKKALAIRKKLYGNQPHADIAASLGNIGFLLFLLKRRKMAEMAIMKAKNMWEAVIGDQDHPDRARSMMLPAKISKEIGGNTIPMWKRLYGNQPHPDLALALDFHLSHSHLEEAIKYSEEALAMRKKLYSNQPHPALVNALLRHASILNNPNTPLGEQKALNYLNEAYLMLQKACNDYPDYDFAQLFKVAGILFRRLNKNEKALDCYQQSLAIMRKLFSDEHHPDFVNTLKDVLKQTVLKQLDKGPPSLEPAHSSENTLAGLSQNQCERSEQICFPSLPKTPLFSFSPEEMHLCYVREQLMNHQVNIHERLKLFTNLPKVHDKEQMIASIDFENIPPKDQEAFFWAMEKTPFTHLHLEGCTALTDSWLAHFLKYSPRLESLRLINCPQLTRKSLASLENMPLRTLHLENLVGVTEIHKQHWFNPVELPLPQLQSITFIHLPHFQSLIIQSPLLSEFHIFSCPQLSQDALQKLVSTTENLQKLDIQDCPQIDYRTLAKILFQHKQWTAANTKPLVEGNTLNLNGFSVSDACLQAIGTYKLPVKSIDLRNCTCISWRGLVALRQYNTLEEVKFSDFDHNQRLAFRDQQSELREISPKQPQYCLKRGSTSSTCTDHTKLSTKTVYYEIWDTHKNKCINKFDYSVHRYTNNQLDIDFKEYENAIVGDRFYVYAPRCDIFVKDFTKSSFSKNYANLTGHTAKIDCFCDLGGYRLASGSRDQTIKIWDVMKSVCLKTLTGHNARVTAICKMGNYLLSGDARGYCKLWDLEAGTCLVTFQGPEQSIQKIVVEESHRRIFTFSGSYVGILKGQVNIFDSQTGTWLASINKMRSHNFWVSNEAIISECEKLSYTPLLGISNDSLQLAFSPFSVRSSNFQDLAFLQELDVLSYLMNSRKALHIPLALPKTAPASAIPLLEEVRKIFKCEKENDTLKIVVEDHESALALLEGLMILLPQSVLLNGQPLTRDNILSCIDQNKSIPPSSESLLELDTTKASSESPSEDKPFSKAVLKKLVLDHLSKGISVISDQLMKGVFVILNQLTRGISAISDQLARSISVIAEEPPSDNSVSSILVAKDSIHEKLTRLKRLKETYPQCKIKYEAAHTNTSYVKSFFSTETNQTRLNTEQELWDCVREIRERTKMFFSSELELSEKEIAQLNLEIIQLEMETRPVKRRKRPIYVGDLRPEDLPPTGIRKNPNLILVNKTAPSLPKKPLGT